MNEPKIDGFKIRGLREARHISAVDLGAAAGVTDGMIYKIEDGAKGTRAVTLKAIADCAKSHRVQAASRLTFSRLADFYGLMVDELYLRG